MQLCFDFRHDIGVHPVVDHRGVMRMRGNLVERRAEHHRVRLAHDVGVFAGRLRDEGIDGTRRGESNRRRFRNVHVATSPGCTLARLTPATFLTPIRLA